MSQEQLAAAANVSVSTISKIERGETIPERGTLVLLAKPLGVWETALRRLADGTLTEIPNEAMHTPTGMTDPQVGPTSAPQWADTLIRFTFKTPYADQHEALQRMLPREVARLRDLLDDFLKPADERQAKAAG
jgi:transcriptional regulator with XRE-family HTH domain